MYIVQENVKFSSGTKCSLSVSACNTAAAAATQTIWLLTLRNVLAHSFVACVFAPQQLVQLTLLCVW